MPQAIPPGSHETRVMVKIPPEKLHSVRSAVRSGERRAEAEGIITFSVPDVDAKRAQELIKRDILETTNVKPEEIQMEVDQIQHTSKLVVTDDDGAAYNMPKWLFRFFRWAFFHPIRESAKQISGYKWNDKLYYVSKVGFDQAWRSGWTGTGISVGVNDTGCGPNSHVTYISNLNTVGFDEPVFEDNNDRNGHGTHVAGTIRASGNKRDILGAAPNCDLRVYKSGEGYFYTSDLIQAIDYAIKHGVKVLNNSWGGAYSQFLQDTITRALKNDMIIVKAAGNESDLSPDMYDDCIMVTAISEYDRPSGYTNYVDEAHVKNTVACYGNDILSLLPDERTGFKSGTSMASPIVSAAVALLREKYKGLPAQEVMKIFFERCIVPTDMPRKFGCGRLSLIKEFNDGKTRVGSEAR